MFPRGVAVCSVLALATIAQGGVTVQLVPNPNQATYLQNQVVQVDVRLLQAPGGSDQLLRLVEFDLTPTSSFLTVALPTTHDMGTPGTGDDVHFWSFSSLANCVSTPSFCGFGYFIDDKMAAGPVDTRANVLSIAYYKLTADASSQILLQGGATPAPVTVGKLQVTMPGLDGDYRLNLVNAADTGADRGARVDFGMDPHTIWRAKNVAPNDVSGGVFTFTVGPPTTTGACCVGGNTCNTGVSQATCTSQGGVYQGDGSTTCANCPSAQCNLTSSIPAFTSFGNNTVPANGTLWRSLRHIARLAFSCATLPSTPTPGQVEIVELLAGGAFGPDVSSGFAFTIESGNVLKVRETSTTTTALVHRHWYAVRNTGGWTGVANFEAQFPVQAGDASGDNRVLNADVLQINSGVACVTGCGDQNRLDIDGDGRVLNADVLQANTRVTSLPVPKPTGH